MTPIARDNWQTLEPLLDRALDLAPAERSQWLEELSGRSPDLAAELHGLLAEEALADRDGFLTALPEVSAAGLELGAYRLERPLGQGGMGTVWLARRSDGRFEGMAAVKLLNLALLSSAGQERFRREGSTLARLAHPGIARLLDAGVSGAGQPYLVLEYVDGRPIDVFVREQELTLAGRIRLFLQVLAAVGHAHTNLIVHRDLKPSNILVTADGTVKLLDFGIAKLLGDEAVNERSALTQEGGRLFTPLYAAPEQVLGETLTTASDVYALGVLLYVLLAGRHPTAEHARTPAECVTALLEAEPAPLRLGDLDTILAKALRKTPAERYQSVVALADDLERYLRSEPVSARAQSLGYRLGKFVRRNRIIVTAAAVTLVALVGASLFSLGQARRAARERDVAVHASERAEAVMGFQRQLLTQIGDRPMTMKQILDGGLALLQRRHTGHQALAADVLAAFGGIYSDLGDSRTARTLLARAESLATAGQEAPSLLSIRCATARLMVDLGHLDSVTPNLALFDRLEASQAELTADSRAVCLDARGSWQVARDQGDSAIATWQQARALLEAAGRTRSESYQVVLGQLGAILVPQGRTREAIAMNRRQLAALDSSGQSGTLPQLNAMSGMAFSLLIVGEVAEAESLSREGVQLVETSGLPLAGQSATVLNRAAITFMMEWHDSSLVWFSRLAQLARETRSPSRERRALFGRGRAEAALGRLAEARQTLARIRDLRDSATAPPSREELHLLGWLRRAQADFAGADSALTELLRRDGYFGGGSNPGSNPGTRPVLLLAAEVAIQLGDPARALKLAGDARQLAAVDTLADVRSAFVGEARLLEARALLASGDTTAARASIERALPALRTGAGPAHRRTREAEALAAALGR